MSYPNTAHRRPAWFHGESQGGEQLFFSVIGLEKMPDFRQQCAQRDTDTLKKSSPASDNMHRRLSWPLPPLRQSLQLCPDTRRGGSPGAPSGDRNGADRYAVEPPFAFLDGSGEVTGKRRRSPAMSLNASALPHRMAPAEFGNLTPSLSRAHRCHCTGLFITPERSGRVLSPGPP
jgi:hypothetical protein